MCESMRWCRCCRRGHHVAFSVITQRYYDGDREGQEKDGSRTEEKSRRNSKRGGYRFELVIARVANWPMRLRLVLTHLVGDNG